MASTDGRRGVAASAASRRACTKALCPGASVPLQGAMTNTGAAPWSRGRPSAQSAGTGSGLVTAMVITCMPSPNKTLFPAPCLLQFAVWLMLFVTQTQGDTRSLARKLPPAPCSSPRARSQSAARPWTGARPAAPRWRAASPAAAARRAGSGGPHAAARQWAPSPAGAPEPVWRCSSRSSCFRVGGTAPTHVRWLASWVARGGAAA